MAVKIMINDRIVLHSLQHTKTLNYLFWQVLEILKSLQRLVVMLIAILQSVITIYVIILNVCMQSVIILSVILMGVVVPLHHISCECELSKTFSIMKKKSWRRNVGDDVGVGDDDSNELRLNRRAHIKHQFRKTIALSCHRCLINTGVEKMNYI